MKNNKQENDQNAGAAKGTAKVEIEWFLDRYKNTINETWYEAKCRLERVEYLLARETPGVVMLNARLRGTGDPVLCFKESKGNTCTAEDEGDPIPFADAIGAIAVEPEDFDALLRFLRLHLCAARCREVLRYWEPVWWWFQGDEQAFDFGKVGDPLDFKGRFNEWLQTDEHARGQWEASGLMPDDLLQGQDE